MRGLVILAFVCTCIAVSSAAVVGQSHSLAKREEEEVEESEEWRTGLEKWDEEESESESQEVAARRRKKKGYQNSKSTKNSAKKRPTRGPATKTSTERTSKSKRPNETGTKQPRTTPPPKHPPADNKIRKKRPQKPNKNISDSKIQQKRREIRQQIKKLDDPPKAAPEKESKFQDVKNQLNNLFNEAGQSISDWAKTSGQELLDILKENAKETAIQLFKDIATEWLANVFSSQTCSCSGTSCDCCADIPAVGAGCLTMTVYVDIGIVDMDIHALDGDNKELLASTTITGSEEDEEMSPILGILDPGFRIKPISLESLYADDSGLKGCFEVGLDIIAFYGVWCVQQDGSDDEDAKIAAEEPDYVGTFISGMTAK